jgi:hypothetical protein
MDCRDHLNQGQRGEGLTVQLNEDKIANGWNRIHYIIQDNSYIIMKMALVFLQSVQTVQ